MIPTTQDKIIAMHYAGAFEIAAKFIEQFPDCQAAAAALDYEAVKLRRKWTSYRVAAPGELEYRSWGNLHDAVNRSG